MKDAVYRAKLELGLQASPPVKMPKTAAAAATSMTTSDHQISKDEESTKAARPLRAAAAQPVVSAWQRSSSTASIVRSASPALTASDAGSLRSETPRSLAPEESTPTCHQFHQDSKSVVSSTAAGPKDGQAQAAASPMTPNAIKAFQPDQLSDSQSDYDMPLASAIEAHSPGACSAEAFHKSRIDGQSICSDEVSDALFSMDPSSESDGDKVCKPSMQEPGHSIKLDTDHMPSQQGAVCKLFASLCLQGESETQLTHSSHSSDVRRFTNRAAGAQLGQQFLQAVGLHKALSCAIQYQTLGFSRLQGIAAVNKWGDDMHAALGWLLNNSEEVQVLHCFCSCLCSYDRSDRHPASACCTAAVHHRQPCTSTCVRRVLRAIGTTPELLASHLQIDFVYLLRQLACVSPCSCLTLLLPHFACVWLCFSLIGLLASLCVCCFEQVCVCNRRL